MGIMFIIQNYRKGDGFNLMTNKLLSSYCKKSPNNLKDSLRQKKLLIYCSMLKLNDLYMT